MAGKLEGNNIRKGGSIVGKVENGNVWVGGSVAGQIRSNGDVVKGGSVVGRAPGFALFLWILCVLELKVKG